MTLGDILADLEISQSELADRLNAIGGGSKAWNKDKIHRICAGKQSMKLHELHEIARALEVTPALLLGGRR